MSEVAGILGTYAAVASLHAAHRGELPLFKRRLGAKGKRGLRWLAFLLLALAFVAARQQLGTLIASLVCGVACCLSGTLVVTLRPLFPRALWGSAYLSAVTALMLVTVAGP
ncbi:MAG: hypothetical protein H6718_28900 [Polyangiaceae bacterium]|nr:hypothetical protein [Myxococcales bacterium]MCB9589467.1 hypothetical protein [Polyangiaceae bacterium]